MGWLQVALTAMLAVTLTQGLTVISREDKREGKIWAVLLAGSASWFNYRHQADVCHAYQILHAHGVPDENIIVMMKDDLAYNSQNPTPGKIINRPDGPDVYKGVPKDYTGDDVTVANFLKVLTGDAEGMNGVGSGKVLKSGPKDHVFINMVDHGAVGIFGFPTEFLSVKDFSNAIATMHRNKMYKEMVIYMEACESGSMFENKLPDNINVVAITAANSTQSSYACYLDNTRHTYLGDVFSVKWMEDSDKENLKKETLKKQYTIVKNETTTSQVSEYGELSILSEHVGVYQGMQTPSEFVPSLSFPDIYDPCVNSSIASPDVPEAVLELQLDAAASTDEYENIKEQIVRLHKSRQFVRDTVAEIALRLTADPQEVETLTAQEKHTVTSWECYETAVQHFHEDCFNLGLNPYALRHVHVLSNLCSHGFTSQEIRKAISQVCTHPPMTEIN